MNKVWQTIISVGAEGGCIALYGKLTLSGQWVFRTSVNDIFSYELEDEPSQSSGNVRKLKSSLPKPEMEADSWEKALKLIERYPWPRLRPLKVHPEFREQVWNEIQNLNHQKFRNRIDSYKLSQWANVCFAKEITLANWLQNSNYTTMLTGAGMSTESNIPDFRSKDGWWRNVDPRRVATTEALHNQYDLFHGFYSMRLKGLENVAPNKGHEILAKWEKEGLIQAVCTQNVDNLHKEAGNQTVHELHGSIHKIRCEYCDEQASVQDFLNKEICSHCGGKLRPGVVLFGEKLPENSWSDSLSHIRKSELVIVIGTSLEVYPVSTLPHMTNGKTVYINAEVVDKGLTFDLAIKGKTGEVLGRVEELLNFSV
jgi:NAD-dependent SIR2 family protein deacetylase